MLVGTIVGQFALLSRMIELIRMILQVKRVDGEIGTLVSGLDHVSANPRGPEGMPRLVVTETTRIGTEAHGIAVVKLLVRSDGIASWGDLGDVSVVRHVVG